jgi:deazaflavin-dependent oxidoreductase (nitroreductase family)
LASRQFAIINTIVNPVIRFILRSPLHSLLDKNLVSITYTGRKSGRRFSLVTQYVQFDSQLVVVAGEPGKKNWWRNFQSKTRADVLLKGQRVAYDAQTLSNDPNAMVPRLAAYCEKFPQSARLRGLQPREDGTFDNEEIAKAAKGTIMVVFGGF